jgi:hypothetical protein
MKFNERAKFIFVARNPWDTCVSYYDYQLIRFKFFGLSKDYKFEDFVKAFVRGDLPWGDWLETISEWYRIRAFDNVCFITYEEMKEDLAGSVLRVAGFLGETFHSKCLENNGEVLQRIVQHCHLQYMKERAANEGKMKSVEEEENENIAAGLAKDVTHSNFFPRGYSGYGKSFFNDDLKEIMQSKMKKLLLDEEFRDLYSIWEKYE